MKNAIFLFLFLISLTSYSQHYLAAAKEDGKWGYIDTKGTWVIQPTFQEASPFSHGLAKVKYSGRFGFIDKKGEWVIKPIYEEAKDYSNGYAKVLYRGWGLLDTTGAEILKPKYSYVDNFSCGFARARTDKGMRMFDKNGKELATVAYKDIESFREGMARVEIKEKFGFIDTTGTLVVKADYQSAGHFSEGLAWVRVKQDIGYINKKGDFIIAPQYKASKNFSDNLTRVFVDNHWSFIDTTGKLILSFDKKIELVSKFSNGFAKIQKGGVGYVNAKGEIVIEPKYVIAKDFHFGVAVVRTRGQLHLIDTTGKKIVEEEFAALDVCTNGYIRAKALKGDWGFIDTKGNWLIKPDFSEVGMFVDINEKYDRGYRGISFTNINDFR